MNMFGDAGEQISRAMAEVATTQSPVRQKWQCIEIHVNLFGDAGATLSGHAIGGNDVITGGITNITAGSRATLKIFGDAGENMTDHAIGGNDLITDCGL